MPKPNVHTAQKGLWEPPLPDPDQVVGREVYPSDATPPPAAPAPKPSATSELTEEQERDFDRIDAQGQGNAVIFRRRAEIDEIKFKDPDHREQRIADRLSREAVDNAVEAAKGIRSSRSSARSTKTTWKPTRARKNARYYRQADQPPPHIAAQVRKHNS